MKYGKRFRRAFQYAAKLHSKQYRKGAKIPYITHLMAVASIVGEAGGDEDEAIAALLHDAVEDQGGRPILKKIKRMFGKRVAEIVDGCTDSYEKPKPPWRPRKEKYIDRLKSASPSVLIVSCADKVHNSRAIVADLREIGNELWGRFNSTAEENLWYYNSVCEVFRTARAPERLVSELERNVDEMERLKG